MENELHVVFGTGPLGLAVMHELVHQGKSVRVVNRSGNVKLPNGVQVEKGDATNLSDIHRVCKNASVIYNCTGAPYTKWPELFPPIMQGIIEGAAVSGAKLIYGDNLYMYGPVAGPMTEDLPYGATGRKGRTRALLADMLTEAHRTGKVRAAIGRGSDFYGPNVLESAVGERVFAAALAGKPAQVLGKLDVPHTYTFIGDFAKGLVTLGEREEALGEIWHIPNAETLTTRKFIELVFEETGRSPKFQVAPKWAIQMLSLFNPYMRELKEMLYEFEAPFVVDHSKYEKAFGANPTPLRDAVRQTLDWYRQRGTEE